MSDAMVVRRKEIAEQRRSLSLLEIETRSARLVGRLVKYLIEKIPSEAVVGLYHPGIPNRDGEIDPAGLIKAEGFESVHFAFPRVLDRFHREMDFSIPLHAPDWVSGVFGHREPRHELLSVSPSEIDILIIPGVIFGVNGERVGRGGGFYDRFLATAHEALRIGVGYDFQITESPLLQSPWDARMDVIMSEERTFEVLPPRRFFLP